MVPNKGSHFRMSKNIQQVYSSHSVIFSHGGAGTLLYCLAHGKKGRKIVAIANHTLAGNHQTELVDKLSREGYLLGFRSVDEMRENKDRLREYLRGDKEMREYGRPQTCLMNSLIFGKSD